MTHSAWYEPNINARVLDSHTRSCRSAACRDAHIASKHGPFRSRHAATCVSCTAPAACVRASQDRELHVVNRPHRLRARKPRPGAVCPARPHRLRAHKPRPGAVCPAHPNRLCVLKPRLRPACCAPPSPPACAQAYTGNSRSTAFRDAHIG